MSIESKTAMDTALILFSKWRLTYQQQCDLLHVASVPSAEDPAYVAFSIENNNLVLRFLAIHALLRTLFPQDLDLAYAWVQQPNQAFGMTPLALMTQGESGIDRVLDYLNRNAQ